MNEKSRIERLLETGQINYYRALELSGETSTEPSAQSKVGSETVRRVVRKRTKRPSRRGGRSYPEPSDSELDPHWNAPFEPLDPEQAALVQEKAQEFNIDRVRGALMAATTREAWLKILVGERKRREQAGLVYDSDYYKMLTDGLDEPPSRRLL